MTRYLLLLGLIFGLVGWGMILWENWFIGIGVLLALWGNNLSQRI